MPWVGRKMDCRLAVAVHILAAGSQRRQRQRQGDSPAADSLEAGSRVVEGSQAVAGNSPAAGTEQGSPGEDTGADRWWCLRWWWWWWAAPPW